MATSLAITSTQTDPTTQGTDANSEIEVERISNVDPSNIDKQTLPQQQTQDQSQAQQVIDNTPQISPPNHDNQSRERVKTLFKFGPYVPLIKTDDNIYVDTSGISDDYKNSPFVEDSDGRFVSEIFPDDSVVDAPSLVTPLLLKKKTIWPPKTLNTDLSNPTDISSSDEVEILRVENRGRGTPDAIVENNPRYRHPEEYLRSTVVANLTNNAKLNSNKPILAVEDFISSAAGDLLLGIGLSRVNEFILEDDVRKLAHKVRKGIDNLVPALDSKKAQLIQTKRSNSRYKVGHVYRCTHCDFKTEFEIVLDGHLEAPHTTYQKFFSCNWCSYKCRDSSQIIFHNNVSHHKYRCRIEKPLAVHCCRYCQYESNSKRKFTSHITKCELSFQQDLNQYPENPEDFPTITSKLINQKDIRTYETTLKNLRLSAYNPHQIRVSNPAYGFNGKPVLVVPRGSLVSMSSGANQKPKITVSQACSPYADPVSFIGRGSAGINKSTSNTASTSHDSNKILRYISNPGPAKSNVPNPDAILQHPRPQPTLANGLAVVRAASGVVMPPPNLQSTMRTSSVEYLDGNSSELRGPSTSSNGTFVICEICDAYIDNLTLFKSHMNWVHKVKIHRKYMESTRPPLHCQKCNWRYFTDQGLERHLLGAHGLVTSTLQDLADAGKDSGRCTICGTRCVQKIVTHMRDVHKMTLRPAQLLYKCTMCGAKFCMYRHFEVHVYRVHGDIIQRSTTDS